MFVNKYLPYKPFSSWNEENFIDRGTVEGDFEHLTWR
jgi:hypothetical protein